MGWLPSLLPMMFNGFFQDLYEQLVKTVLVQLSNIMSFASNSLNLPIVKNGALYAMVLATAIVIPKAGLEIYRTYILFQEGDPDADLSHAIIRSVQAVIMIWCIPLIVYYSFLFGTKLTSDVARLSAFDNTYVDRISTMVLVSNGWLITLLACIVIILIIVVFIQTVIRAADLAGTAVIGSIMATNLTNVSHSSWSAWFRQIIIICCSQAIQIFFLAGAFANPFNGVNGMLLTLGWMIACVKAPKWLQQFAYSTGLGGFAAGAARQGGTMLAMRMLITRG